LFVLDAPGVVTHPLEERKRSRLGLGIELCAKNPLTHAVLTKSLSPLATTDVTLHRQPIGVFPGRVAGQYTKGMVQRGRIIAFPEKALRQPGEERVKDRPKTFSLDDRVGVASDVEVAGIQIDRLPIGGSRGVFTAAS